MEVCRTRPPDLEVAPDHLARCWLFGVSGSDVTFAAGADAR